jgi:hypothetical protein
MFEAGEWSKPRSISTRNALGRDSKLAVANRSTRVSTSRGSVRHTAGFRPVAGRPTGRFVSDMPGIYHSANRDSRHLFPRASSAVFRFCIHKEFASPPVRLFRAREGPAKDSTMIGRWFSEIIQRLNYTMMIVRGRVAPTHTKVWGLAQRYRVAPRLRQVDCEEDQ